MIIERQFVPFGALKETDKEAWEIFVKAFNESYEKFDKERKERLFQALLPLSLYQRETSWCMNKLIDIIEGFEKLDREKPYDNGFDYESINKAYIVYKDEKSVILHLVNWFQGAETLVKVVEISD